MCLDSLGRRISGPGRALALALLLIAPALAAQETSAEEPLSQAQSVATAAGAEAGLRRIEWGSVEGARSYELEIADDAGKPVLRLRVEENWAEVPLSPGKYRVRITVLNRFLRPASVSPWFDLAVIRSEMPQPSTVEPRTVAAGSTEFSLRVAGPGIAEETGARLERGALVLQGRRVAGSGDEAVFVFDLRAVQPGVFDLALENPAGMRNRLPSAIRFLSFGAASTAASDFAADADVPGDIDKTADAEPADIRNADARVADAKATDAKAAEAKSGEAKPAAGDGSTPDEAQQPSGTAGPAEAAVASGTSVDKAQEDAEAPRLSEFNGKRLWIEAGWTGGIFLDGDLSDRFGFGFAGGSVRLLAAVGALFYRSPIMRGVGLELRTDFMSYKADNDEVVSGFMTGTVGVGLFFRSFFRFPVNILARGGFGAAFTSIDTASALNVGDLVSQDSFVYAGAGARIDMGRHFFDVGTEWTGTYYVDDFVPQLRFNVLFAYSLL